MLSYQLQSNCFQNHPIRAPYQIILSFNFWRIDYWNYDDFYVYLDYHKMYSSQFSHTTSNQNICGSSVYNEEIFPMSITIPHTIPAITVIFGVKKGIWGISQMILEAKLCPEDCQSCSENQCFDQYLYFFTLNWENVVNSSEGWLTNNVIQTSVITYLQARYLETYGNHLINEIKLNQHQAISLQVKVLVYNSNPTQINIAIDDIIVSTIQYTGGWINYPNGFGYKSIKIFNIHQYPHIHSQAKITISLILSKNNPSLLLFFAIRDFQLFLKSSLFEFICKDDNLVPFDGCFSQMFDCIEGCSNCIRGTCLDCKTGWEYNELEKICIPICGDSLITHFEECDDGNNVPYDGCHLCKYSCPHNCKTCQFGNCLECNVNYSLSLNKKQCLPFCDDTINFFFEIFDDQTQIDRNLKCQKSCQLECKLCINNTCYQCNGWQLQNNQCHQICGDGLIAINSIELCDDGNFNEIDGCYQCLFECIPYCFFCSDKNTCLQCQEFFTLVDNSCIPICGDGIVINSLEDCEDGNNLPCDGCYQCKLSCIQNCEVCQLGGCEKCNLGYQINDNFCEKVVEEEIQNQDQFCGDGIIQNNESCDDFNSINLDGCSSTCKVENQWNSIAILKHHINYFI
ncbi:unnamed protein product [Paramecium primaurelia]|uniref:Uncharacterized protein n=1 Tax=Paramecium primaurelia TaxID=5886 RepID=A0A8S1JMT2_PARPR|nr:unnamed protein product [Paramecium primaurelia]